MSDEPPANNRPSSDEPESDLHLAPTQAEPPPRARAPLTLSSGDSAGPPTDPPAQFSLGEMLIWMAIVSIGLSGLAWMGPPVFAGVCGFLALGLLIVSLIWKPGAPLFQILWYALLVMYATAIIIAIFAPPHARH
jgi:hypothetical protein